VARRIPAHGRRGGKGGLERLRAIVTNYEGTDPEKVVNDDFESGLERVLDGLQARLDGRS
jgi:hypothetical protein